MRYLIAQQWANIKGNHAGYPHICNLLEKSYPKDYKLIECPPLVVKERSTTVFGKILKYYIDPYFSKEQYKKDLRERCDQMLHDLKDGDEVYLLEYNMPKAPQLQMAKYIKSHYRNVRVMAMTHLTPSMLQYFGQNKIKLLEWDKPIDKHITLGSSLSAYFKSIGIKENKISTGFHAVDMDYYHPLDEKVVKTKTTIIAMGALQRDYSMLSEVVKRCPEVNWIICKGKRNVGNLFEGLSNVNLVGFVEEDELRRLMNSADVSMSVLQDTIGSNVITTSMAMGLAMVVSDVGSIRDYCDDNNTIFCNNTIDDFVQAINALKDRAEVERMKQASLERVKQFSISRTHEWFSTL